VCLFLSRRRYSYRVAVCCSVLQCVAQCCNVLEPQNRVAVCCSVLQCVAVCCSALQSVAMFLSRRRYSYRVAKTHRMPHLYRSFSAKETYN